MSTDLYKPPPAVLALAERAEAYAKTSRSPATQLAYQKDLEAFRLWTEATATPYQPTDDATLAMYAAHLADEEYAASSISRALSAICSVHRHAGFLSPRGPLTDSTVEGIRRQLGTAPDQRAPLTTLQLTLMVSACGDRLIDHRDRLVLVLGWVGAFRRSEIVALRVEDIRKVPTGLEVTVRKSKTDQQAVGRVVALPRSMDVRYCPVALFETWLKESGIEEGFVFRAMNLKGQYTIGSMRPQNVADVIKRRAEAIGLDSEKFSGHSLRSGLVTAAANAGRSIVSIMRTTGHTSERMALKYVRGAELWTDCAAKGLL